MTMIAELAGTMSEEDLTYELLGAYEACESLSDHFAEWCQLVGLDPRTDEADNAYRVVHNAYADLWNAVGSGVFFTRVYEARDRWIAYRRASERAGKQTLVRAFARLLGHA